GPTEKGMPIYVQHLGEVEKALAAFEGPPVTMQNGLLLVDTIGHFILGNAISPAMMRRMQTASGRGFGVAAFQKVMR
ncbi:MAG TPA: hypothetical protein VK192_07960, partial [Sphingomicrobium sp.]|nr:hypothetical protein [Sphingomicrobium sp.]